MSQLKYWVWYSTKQIGARKKDVLLSLYGSVEDIYYADGYGEEVDEPARAELSDKSFERAERVMEMCDLRGIGILTLQDALYPNRLKNIDSPPMVLYYKGRLPAFDEEAAVAVIGTRKPTPYGLNAAERMAFQITQLGGYVISGMAEGCDGAASRGALKAGGPTAVVLGGGPDVVYPTFHRELYEDIVSAGVVISEYPPGTESARGHFPQRNRIISGLALGVLVTEAGRTSGTRITADYAFEQGKDVFAVPGPIDNEAYVGTNELIRDGGAKLVMSAADIMTEYAKMYPHKITLDIPRVEYAPRPQPQKRQNVAVAVEIKPVPRPDAARIEKESPNRRSILLAVQSEPRFVDDLVAETGLIPSVLLGELTMLCIEGALEELPGKRYRIGKNMLI